MQLTTKYIVRLLSELGVSTFSTEEYARLMGLPLERAHASLHRLARSGAVRRLRRGRYLLAGHGEPESLGRPLFLGAQLAEPGYIAFWSALHYYGWTDQAPRVVFVANTRRSGRRQVGAFGFQLVRLARHRFFGYRTAREGSLEFPVAEPEKAILDAFYLPRLVGGIDVAASSTADALATLDMGRLEDYAARMQIPSLCSRLGDVLEDLGVESEALRRLRARSYVKLEPLRPRRGRFVSKWNVIDNRGAG